MSIKANAALSKLPFANDGSFFEQYLKRSQEAPPEVNDPYMRPAEHYAADAEADTLGSTGKATCEPAQHGISASFIGSRSFLGAKHGYVFKTGANGVGYYVDVPLAQQQVEAQRNSLAKPVVLKAKKSIVQVQRTTLTQADNKKRKLESTEDDKPKYLKEMERYRSLSCSSDTKHDRPLVK